MYVVFWGLYEGDQVKYLPSVEVKHAAAGWLAGARSNNNSEPGAAEVTLLVEWMICVLEDCALYTLLRCTYV